MTPTERAAACDALCRTLAAGHPPEPHTSEALCFAALDAAGVGGTFRAAVLAAGGPRAVLQRGALTAFVSPRRRRQLPDGPTIALRLSLLSPWLAAGIRPVADERSVCRLADHPATLVYGAGASVPDAARPVIAIVGSREAGPALCATTAAAAARFAKQGAVVVSGGAMGIDTAAQQAARRAGGEVVVISGQALVGRVAVPTDVVVDPGLCWLTPYAPWSPGRPHGRFAQRNAFIAAMADVVVAVAGGPTSGTRHTIEAALSYGRPVVSFSPSSAQPELAFLARRLADSGAGTIVPDDVDLAALLATPPVADGLRRWHEHGQLSLPLAVSSSSSTFDQTGALGCESRASEPAVLRLLRARGPLSLDEAASALGVSVRELLVDVAELELDGALHRDGAVVSVARCSSLR